MKDKRPPAKTPKPMGRGAQSGSTPASGTRAMRMCPPKPMGRVRDGGVGSQPG